MMQEAIHQIFPRFSAAFIFYCHRGGSVKTPSRFLNFFIPRLPPAPACGDHGCFIYQHPRPGIQFRLEEFADATPRRRYSGVGSERGVSHPSQLCLTKWNRSRSRLNVEKTPTMSLILSSSSSTCWPSHS